MVDKKYPLPEHIQLAWPVDPSFRKGVIFYIHGFGSYCERYAFQAKMWAEAGYEVIAMD
jgi:alpha-beta hydrolase superfamily lysophospholipase